MSIILDVPYPTSPAADSSLAERKRQLVRDELAEAALRLMALQGFEATTVDQIVAASGVSRRTFSRYFQSKEDVVVQFLGHLGAKICTALAARPLSESPDLALRQALSVLVQACLDEPEKSLRLVQVMLSTPALRARFLERQAQWRADIAAELARRTGLDPQQDVRPDLAAAVALAAFDTALGHWSASDGTSNLADLTDQAFSVVTSALNA
jgi:AcrR family transcriptional regulator